MQLDENQSPSTPHPVPEYRSGKWFLPNPIAARLHQKSGLGVSCNDGILLESFEVLFCHWNRFIPIDNSWLNSNLSIDQDLIAKSIIFDVARSGGEIVIPTTNLSDFEYSKSTFAVKWNRNKSHFSEPPISQVKWFWSFDDVDWPELENWLSSVNSMGHEAEIFVVDDEMDVTMYRVNYEVISGNQISWKDLSANDIDSVNQSILEIVKTSSGGYIPIDNQWPLETIGVEHLSGINLRFEEIEYIKSKLSSKPNNNSLFSHLVDLGCILRPGFKYGCKWRAYDDDVSTSHAPWLVQPISDAPHCWEAICLAVRLAEGVNKKWLCAKTCDGEWKFINIKRWLPGKN